MNLTGKKIGFCLCGSFCTLNKAVEALARLKETGASIYPVISENAGTINTRFGKAKDFIEKVTDITGNKPIMSIEDAEPIGPKNSLDIMAVVPCTSNTMAKLCYGITDSAVTMACKAHLRNNKPLVLAIATNDALGTSLRNIGGLMVRKNIYFVPFGQDDHIKKPLSMTAELDLLEDTLCNALEGKQLQPIVLGK